MHIRQLALADVPALREIDRVSFGANDQYSDVQYTQAVTGDSSDALGVVGDRGTVIAWALIDRACVPVRIRSLAVHPEFRRHGVGTLLVREAIARYDGPIDLLVDPANANAIVFYRGLGFVSQGTDPHVAQRLRMLHA